MKSFVLSANEMLSLQNKTSSTKGAAFCFVKRKWGKAKKPQKNILGFVFVTCCLPSAPERKSKAENLKRRWIHKQVPSSWLDPCKDAHSPTAWMPNIVVRWKRIHPETKCCPLSILSEDQSRTSIILHEDSVAMAPGLLPTCHWDKWPMARNCG